MTSQTQHLCPLHSGLFTCPSSLTLSGYKFFKSEQSRPEMAVPSCSSEMQHVQNERLSHAKRVLPDVSKNPRTRRYRNVGNYLPKESVTSQNRILQNAAVLTSNPDHAANSRNTFCTADALLITSEGVTRPRVNSPICAGRSATSSTVSLTPVQLGIQRHTFRSMPL